MDKLKRNVEALPKRPLVPDVFSLHYRMVVDYRGLGAYGGYLVSGKTYETCCVCVLGHRCVCVCVCFAFPVGVRNPYMFLAPPPSTLSHEARLRGDGVIDGGAGGSHTCTKRRTIATATVTTSLPMQKHAKLRY